MLSRINTHLIGSVLQEKERAFRDKQTLNVESSRREPWVGSEHWLVFTWRSTEHVIDYEIQPFSPTFLIHNLTCHQTLLASTHV